MYGNCTYSMRGSLHQDLSQVHFYLKASVPLGRVTASRLYGFTAYLNESEQCAMWMDAYILRPRRRVTSSSRPSGHPEGSCCRTATSTWPSMPTLKNKKICDDVPPQLDLGPRPSFDSAHLERALGRVSRVSVKMINEPPRLLRSYSNLYGIRLLFTLRYDLYTMQL